MIYIHKSTVPKSLHKYATDQIATKNHPSYAGNWDKDEFRKHVAINEQHNLCCYCMNTITANNSTIEHFLPESIFDEEVANHYNLFLACNHSKTQPKRNQHCDTSSGAKADKLIAKYISHPDCEILFAYNAIGEILPKCQFKNIKKCHKEYSQLNSEQKMVLATIEVLNLNAGNLTSQRKNIYEVSYNKYQSSSINELKQELEKYYKGKNDGTLGKFCGIEFYLLRERLNLLGENSFIQEKHEEWKSSLSRKTLTVTTHPLY